MVGPASLSVVSYTDRRPFLVRLNDGGTDLSAIAAALPQHGDSPVGGGAGSADADPANPESASAEANTGSTN